MWEERRELSISSSSQQAHQFRTSVFLEISHDGYRGVGEISPHDDAVWFDPSRESVRAYLSNVIAPRLTSRRGSGASVLHLTDASGAARSASALVEMALCDWTSALHDMQPENYFAGPFRPVTQATISALTPPTHRISVPFARIKVAASTRADHIRALVGPGTSVLLDANGDSVSLPDAQGWADALGDALRALEQPCRPGDWNSSVPLVASGLPVYLDEAIRSITDVRNAARYRAAVGVCVKVERVGGFAIARRVIEFAETAGLAVYLGGFFESPWAKRWHRAFASQFNLGPSDVAGPDGVERPEPHGDVWRATLK